MRFYNKSEQVLCKLVSNFDVPYTLVYLCDHMPTLIKYKLDET